MKIYEYSATEIAEKIRKKEITATEVIEQLNERIKKVDDKIGAYVDINLQTALEMAKKVDENVPNSKLYGVPVALKDNIVSYKEKTTAASKILANYVGTYDATVVKRMKKAGIIPFGKANMDEFAMGSSTENSSVKITSNPFDFERIPGGSSGGSAAMVAAQEAFIALGSDTGGSVRQPASLTGTVGLKPTYGRVSRYGLMAFGSSLDQIGIIARQTKDVASLLEIIAGYDELDATTAKKEVPEYTKLLDRDISNLTIGLPKEYFTEKLDKGVRDSIEKAIEELKKIGVKFKEISLPYSKYAISTYYVISSAEAASNLARYDGVRYGVRASDESVEDMYVKTRTQGFGKEVKRRIMIGNYVLCSGFYDAYYKRASQIRRLIKEDFEKALKEVDLILTPTSPVVAFKKGEKISDPITMYLSDIYTVCVSMAGLPAISIPSGMYNNLPVGMQLIGNYFEEDKILNVANIYENIRGKIKYPEI
ncbi:Asp-tRNA(Asn)/Glu-tRNA(Gln) amidotransferase subunit GatA [Sneathia sanguinegens]|uniref:Asp-tRNA(Asn)/Glu-tRNA(Gln) amidotransferase subunit GatA n=1 Tax=Sneathia sanguinegens TaxID=40543 RepID=UPI0023F9B235|nr:Asp-tRNA(Asn)/Glu-tRNA(Gln) amidotransferase subunit GatA [Sneathia sanguinegens]MDU7497164.1 Asp-tRNA(Asn)/Glu-tRNA(Gln) amidotransferase subunit GatA [Sneathia sanguinegens]